MKPLFRSDMTELGREPMATPGVVVRGLGRLDDMVPVARQLAIGHVGYGEEAAHCDVVGESLLRTPEQGLGAAFTPEAEAACARAYVTLAGAMKAAAYPASEPARA